MDEFTAQAREALRRAWEWIRRESARARARVVELWRGWRASRREVAERRRVQLEAAIVATADDDLASITGRIDVADDLEVVLIVPRGARRLREPSVWPHLAAHSRRRGVDLLVVSPRRDVRAHAVDNGLRAAGSVGRARRGDSVQFSLGGRSFRVPRFPLGRWIRAALLVLAIGAIGVVGCYAIPSAEIVIVPVSSEVTQMVSVRLDPLATEPDAMRLIVPAERRSIRIVTVVSTTTTGSTEIGHDFATVEVEFTNESAGRQVVAAGFQLISEDDILFATNLEVEVPAGGTARVGATAVFPGEPGNVVADSLTARDPLPRGMSATNPSAATGGTNVEVAAVTAEDVDRVREISRSVLLRAGEREMAAAIGAGSTFFPETLTSAVFSELPLSNPGDPGDAFLMEYTAIISALVLDATTATDFGSQLLQGGLPADQALLPGSTEVVVAADTRSVGGQLVVDLTIIGRVAPLLDPTLLEGDLTGASKASASAIISQAVDLESPPEIRLLPDFIPWRWLPRRADRISIRLAGPGFEALTEPTDGDEAVTSGDGSS